MLFHFFKTNRGNKENFQLEFTRDIHAHLLPEVDDGPESMEQSIALIKAFQRLGLKRLTATPHVYEQYYPNSKSELLNSYIDLQNHMTREGLEIEVDLAAEYYLDEYFLGLLDRNELLTLGDKYLLVETSFVAPPPNLYDYFFEIQTRGYKPILAHPERYIYLEEEDYEKLLDFGCQFQVNLLSFCGYYGRQIRRRAFKLLEMGMLHAIGSDIHRLDQLLALERLLKNPKLKPLAEKQWLNEFV